MLFGESSGSLSVEGPTYTSALQDADEDEQEGSKIVVDHVEKDEAPVGAEGYGQDEAAEAEDESHEHPRVASSGWRVANDGGRCLDHKEGVVDAKKEEGQS